MTKAVRIKADPLVIGDMERAESAMQELAALEREVRSVTDAMNAQVDALKENAKATAAPLDARKKALTDALGTYLKMNRTEILKGRKSVELTFGLMGFRASSAISQMRGVSVEMTLDRMKNAGLPEGIRTKEELDKDAVRGWPDERLSLVGLVRQEKDQFFVELKQEYITQQTV